MNGKWLRKCAWDTGLKVVKRLSLLTENSHLVLVLIRRILLMAVIHMAQFRCPAALSLLFCIVMRYLAAAISLGAIISADMDYIGQLQPHTPVKFEAVSMEDALSARKERHELLDQIGAELS